MRLRVVLSMSRVLWSTAPNGGTCFNWPRTYVQVFVVSLRGPPLRESNRIVDTSVRITLVALRLGGGVP